MPCPICGSNQVESEPTSGASICTNCGTVLEENTIVSEVTFAENAAGGSVLQGQFVSATTGTKPMPMGPGVGGFSRESREVTLQNGRRKIVTIATALHLSSFHVDAAQRLFTLAVQHNFIQGRRTQNVVAACLYIVCRTERTPHMLIDFSDVLETNVFVLGDTYLKFSRLLNLRLPIVDPSLYIHRFAAKLEFGDKTQTVAISALRLVSRMKRDWMQVGRRPSGICGAGILIAARLHGFKRTQKEIVHVVKICDVTLRKRLLEFEETPSGKLTPQEFETIDLEDEADPPSFTQARKRKGHGTSHLPAPAALASASSSGLAPLVPTYVGTMAGSSSSAATGATTAALGEGALDARMAAEMESTGRVLEEALLVEGVDGREDDPSAPSQSLFTPLALTTTSSSSSATMPALPRAVPRTAGAAAAMPMAPPTAGLRAPNIVAPLGRGVVSMPPAPPMEEDDGELSDMDDEEVLGAILSHDEVQVKSELWHEMNRDYLTRMEEKRRLVEEGTIKEPKKKKRRKGAADVRKGAEVAETPAEAAIQALSHRKISKKINYQVVEELLSQREAVSFDTPLPPLSKVEPMVVTSARPRAVRPPAIGAASTAAALPAPNKV